MSANRSETEGLRIAVVSLTAEAGAALAAAAAAHPAGGGDSAAVSLRMPAPGAVDWSSLALWLIATGTVAAGALWAGQGHLAGLGRESGTPTAKKGGAGEVPAVTISSRAAVGFVLLASAMLVLLFFFLDKWLAYILVRGVWGRGWAGGWAGGGGEGTAHSTSVGGGAGRALGCLVMCCATLIRVPPVPCACATLCPSPVQCLPLPPLQALGGSAGSSRPSRCCRPAPWPLAGQSVCPGRLAGHRHGPVRGAAAA